MNHDTESIYWTKDLAPAKRSSFIHFAQMMANRLLVGVFRYDMGRPTKSAKYLTRLKDEAYRDHVFAYVAKEDTPRPLLFQLDLLRQVGFAQVDVLHKNVCFAAFGAVKA